MKDRVIQLSQFMMDIVLKAKGLEAQLPVMEFSQAIERLLKDSEELKKLREEGVKHEEV